jgi:hypothetical protein
VDDTVEANCVSTHKSRQSNWRDLKESNLEEEKLSRFIPQILIKMIKIEKNRTSCLYIHGVHPSLSFRTH